MIERILNEISVNLLKTEENRNRYISYDNMRKTEGWRVHQALIIEIANKLAEYMLSKSFTRLNIREKDAQQRAFYATKEIIDFLLEPLKGAEKYAAIVRHNKQMEATLKRK